MKRLVAILLAGLVTLPAMVALAGPGPVLPPDIEGHWAETEIRELLDLGIVNGYPDGTFRPDEQVSRAAFLKMLVTAVGLEPRRTLPSPFTDTVDHWCYARGYLEAALRHGILAQYDYWIVETVFTDDPSRPQTFQLCPDKAVTRLQATTLTVRAMGLGTEAGLFRGQTPFIDALSSGAVAVAVATGVIGGYPDGSFRPDDGLTRAQAAVMVDRMLEALKCPREPIRGTFVRTFGNGRTGADAVERLADGGFIIAGRKQDWGAPTGDAWLARMDSAGRLVWERTFGGPAFTDLAYDVLPTRDGGFVMTGVYGAGQSGSDDGWVIKTDASGAKTFEVLVFGSPSGDEARAVVEASAGGYVVAGTRDTGPPSPLEDRWGEAMVARLDASGKEVWSTRIVDEARTWDLAATPDGGYVVAGTLRDAAEFHRQHGWAAKVKDDGTLVWLKMFVDTPHLNDEIRRVVVSSDGRLLLTGNARGKVRLVKTDANGALLWDQRLEVIENRIATVYGVAQAAGGGYLLVGAAPMDIWLAKTDAEGALVWSRVFYRGEVDEATAVAPDPDGGCVMVTRPTQPNPGGAVLIKTDAEGRLFLFP